MDILQFLRSLPNQTGQGLEWLNKPEAIRQYPWYSRIFNAVNPTSILEFGTYLGYGLATAVVSTMSLDRIQWIDNESYAVNSNKMAAENIGVAIKQNSMGRDGDGPKMEYWKDWESAKTELKYPIDLVHIDGDHTFNGCTKDIERAMETRADYIIGHDYSLEEYGVGRAVRAFCDEYKMAHFILPDFTHGLWAISKKPDLLLDKLIQARVGTIQVVPFGGGQ